MDALWRWCGSWLCGWGWHRLGKPYLFPRDREPWDNVVLSRCVRCGVLRRRSQ
jgi:hypothetical protein